jgi:NADPH:quinone reductase-like Zn-dependent oxidoreductase
VIHQTELPVPKPPPTYVLVKAHAAALNPIGYKSIKYFPGFMVKKPCVPEFDCSGVVISVGSKADRCKPGDEVYGITPANTVFRNGQGTLAEYTIVEQDNLYPPTSQIDVALGSLIS